MRILTFVIILWITSIMVQNLMGHLLPHLRIDMFYMSAMLVLLRRKDHESTFLSIFFGLSADAFTQSHFGTFTLIFFVSALLLRPFVQNLYNSGKVEACLYYGVCLLLGYTLLAILFFISNFEFSIFSFMNTNVLLSALIACVIITPVYYSWVRFLEQRLLRPQGYLL